VLLYILLLSLTVGLAVRYVYRACQEDEENKEKCFERLRSLETPADQDVVLLDPESALWHGKAAYVQKRLEQLVQLIRQRKEGAHLIVPIRVGVAKSSLFYTTLAWAKRLRGLIVISDRHLYHPLAEIDNALAHELAHLLTPNESKSHGVRWEMTYHILCRALKAADRGNIQSVT